MSDFAAPALSDQELNRERGANLEAETPSLSDTEDNLAVILWDEFKWPNGSISASGTQAGSVTISN